jgi:long-chain fatty acid transport protein
MELNSKLSAGLTLYYYQKRTMWILNQIIKTDRIDPTSSTGSPGYEWRNDKYLSTEWGFRPVLGFMLTPVDNVSVGFALSKVFIEGSNTMSQVSMRAENIYPAEADFIYLPDGQTTDGHRRNYPTQMSLGVAWFPTQSLLLVSDVNYFTKVNEQVLRPELEAVTNIALGTEYYLTKSWAMRAGLYTDHANTPKIRSDLAGQNEHIDLYGGTLSVSNFTRNTSVTVGTGYTKGNGKAQITGGSNIQDVSSTGWMFFLSSSYSY